MWQWLVKQFSTQNWTLNIACFKPWSQRCICKFTTCPHRIFHVILPRTKTNYYIHHKPAFKIEGKSILENWESDWFKFQKGLFRGEALSGIIFNLVTTEKSLYQILLSDIEEKIKSMWFVLKPTKCRSLSIENGKDKNINFKLMNSEIDLVIDKRMKFLGSVVGAPPVQCLWKSCQN